MGIPAIVLDSKGFSYLARTFLFLTVVGMLALIAYLTNSAIHERAPFDTDEADHAVAGLDLFTSIGRGDAGQIFDSIRRQSFYPPVQSFVTAISYALTGPTLASSRVPSIVCFAAYFLAVAATVVRLLRRSPLGNDRNVVLFSATMALVLGFSSPETVENSVLCMLEPLGMLLVAWLLLLLADDESGARTSAKRTLEGVVLSLIMLTKYSFGVVVIPAYVAATLHHRYQAAGGSGDAKIGSYLKNMEAILCFCIVLAGWISVTDRYSMLRFFIGHPSSGSMFRAEHLLFYPRGWLFAYTPHALLAVALIPLIALGGWSFRNLLITKYALWSLLLACVIFTISTTDELRHFLIVLPGLWVLAGLGVAKLLQKNRMLVAIGFSFLLIYSGATKIDGLPDRLRRAYEGTGTFYKLQEFVSDNVQPDSPILANGLSDQFSPQMLRWLLARNGKLRYPETRLEVYPFRPENYQRAIERKRHIDRPWLVSDFPKEPLQAVVDRGYYQFAVQLRNTRVTSYRGEPAEEFSEVTKDMQQKKLRVGEWEVVVSTIPQYDPSKTKISQ